MRKIRVVSLDFGGTIAYEPKEEYVVYAEILEELGYEADIRYVKEKFEEAKKLWNEKNSNQVWTEDTHARFLENFYSLLQIEDNIERLARETLRIYPNRLEIHLFEDVLPTLESLKNNELKLIVISNIASEERLKTYLTRLGVIHYFDELIASGSVGFEKPSPQIFHHACKLAGCSPSELIHVGDSYEHDYIGAEGVGALGVVIDRNNKYSDKNCRRISDMRELLELLKEAL